MTNERFVFWDFVEVEIVSILAPSLIDAHAAGFIVADFIVAGFIAAGFIAAGLARFGEPTFLRFEGSEW